MSRGVVVTLFLLVAGSMATLIKWEFKRFRRSRHLGSKAFRRHLEERRDEPGRAYVPPPERAKRAFEHGRQRDIG